MPSVTLGELLMQWQLKILFSPFLCNIKLIISFKK